MHRHNKPGNSPSHITIRRVPQTSAKLVRASVWGGCKAT